MSTRTPPQRIERHAPHLVIGGWIFVVLGVLLVAVDLWVGSVIWEVGLGYALAGMVSLGVGWWAQGKAEEARDA